MQTRLRIGTRGSRLALWQAGAVRDALAAAHGLVADAFEIVPIRTSGDRIKDRPLDEIGGKALFTREIEEALLSGDIAFAVHSAKDMETFLRPGLVIGACLEREDARDVLISRDGTGLDALPHGTTIGTASPRREALIRRARPDVAIELLRGNVPTRLQRVEEGRFAATLLAAAGLMRLGLEAHITEYLSVERFPPACGQGALAVECREGDAATLDLLAAIDHRETSLALACERAFLAALGGSCRSPIAGYARIEGGALSFDGTILSADGREHYSAHAGGPLEDAVQVGRAAGEDIRRLAPVAFLQKLGIG